MTSTTTARTFLGARRPRSRPGTLTERLSQYQLLEVLSWREKPFFALVVPDQVLHLLAQCWFHSYTEAASDFQSETFTVFTVTSTSSTSELVVVISCNSHDTTFASWHIFTCHNALRLYKNSHNTKFRVVAVSLMPQRVVVVFSRSMSIFDLWA